MTLIKEYKKRGLTIEYGQGNFDEYCVYYKYSPSYRIKPLDKNYFEKLRMYAQKYGIKRIYKDFCTIYDLVDVEFDYEHINQISKIANQYEMIDKEDIDIMFVTFYATMLSEQLKAFRILGKRIKKLGVYTLLIEQKPLDYCINFMKGMPWKEIDILCKERGF